MLTDPKCADIHLGMENKSLLPKMSNAVRYMRGSKIEFSYLTWEISDARGNKIV